jgi:GT2 family glycosyltransferase
MRTSLIVVVWNGKSYLSKCLYTLQQELTSADELIVVDNASVDGSPEYIVANFPEIKLVRSAQNLGYAGGVNCGLETAQGEYFFIFNQDLELHSGWLSHMMRALAESNVGVVGCKILYPDGLLQHAGGMIRWPQALPDHYGHRQVDDGRWDQPRDVDYVTGAAWGFSRALIERISALDVSFWPGYFEEVDFCFRAVDAGFRVRYVPDAVAVHVESTTLKQGSVQYISAFHKNRLRFVFKRMSPKQFVEAFVPAERFWLEQAITPHERDLMGSVYKLSMLTAAEVYATRSNAAIRWSDVQYVLQGLTALWQRTRALLS